jgi:hypothetical protein
MIKHKKRHLGFIILMAMALFISRRPLSAQENEPGLTIQQLRIQVMPEFDDPRVLVIVQGRLNAGAADLPRPVTFRLPLGAQINQMAVMDVTDGSTRPLAYDTAPDPADPRWTQVTYTLDSAHFFYEFYYDPLASGREREFTYGHSTLQAVNDLQVEIQEPLRATGFATTPAAAQTRTDPMLGFTYHQFTPGSLAAGAGWSANVTYTKPDQDPSLSREAVLAMQNGDPSSVSTSSLASSLATAPDNTRSLPAGNGSWLFAGVAVLLFVGGVFVVRNRWWVSAGTDDRPDADPTPTNYCPQCGSAVRGEARFCSACGHRLAV